ncbi:MAG: tyrosine-type recombinase/integrase [Alphaproteobacteria bacterium]|nr:tyrosine-type recombinase/integrase [Alphaproteobacteria bacterium]MBU2084718.1 tyrosine-type recombinase/integrase [Alphaproteobacteria bacterium]MBU2144210.1 tyrosine-type recombinase/integrase [Alphaproteobacteria bacterium]MBU2198319.1 tyrosine-type recombinase/integrase [Alphaproteobacteria bacterium]
MEDELKRPAAGSGQAGHRRLNAGKLTGQKPALKMREVWSIRTRLELNGNVRNLVLFNLAIDSKLRGCDLVRLKVGDVVAGGHVKSRGMIIQKKTGRPVQFEITENTRRSIIALFSHALPSLEDYLFQSRLEASPHLSTRQYARIVRGWVASIGLNPATYGTHSLRRTKVALIYRKTGNLRAVQLLLGRTKLESAVRYLGVDVDDALEISTGIDL